MDSHILDDDRQSLIEELHHYDEATGTAYIERVQDVESIVEANKALYNLSDGVPHFGDGKRVASIPIVVWDELTRLGIADDPVALRAWLNDADNRAFRTLPGRV